MLTSTSNEKIDISYSSDSDISSNAEELQLLEKLRMNENAVISNEKEMQNKIIQYEQKIRELQEELNSQGSTSELSRNINKNQINDKISNSFGSESSNGNRLEFISNVYSNESDNHAFQNKIENKNRFNYTNSQAKKCYSNYPEKYTNRLQLINDMEEFVNNKFNEAEKIMNSLLYSDNQANPVLSASDFNVREIQEQSIQLKAELTQLKKSLYRYLNRHEAAKKKREARENLLNQKIAFLEEREKNLTQIVEMQQNI